MAEAIDQAIGGFDPEIARRLQAAGHELIPSRRTYRHAGYRQNHHGDTIVGVRVDGLKVPLLTSAGKAISIQDVLPERADLAIDETGCVVTQAVFEERWISFLDNTMLYGDPKSEPIPNAEQWIRQTPDTFSESPGYVEIGYDARKPADEIRTHVYDPLRDELVEKLNEQSERSTVMLDAVKGLLEERNEKRGPGRPQKRAEP